MEATLAPKWQDGFSPELDRFSRAHGLAVYIGKAKELATRFFHVESGEWMTYSKFRTI